MSPKNASRPAAEAPQRADAEATTTTTTAAAAAAAAATPADDEPEAADSAPAPAPKRKRGRPPGRSASSAAAAAAKAAAAAEAGPPRKRGRPRKDTTNATSTAASTAAAAAEGEAESNPTPRKRGRPRKERPAVPRDEKAPPKKRGRPPKGGETTRISTDDVAAAEQLEDELDVTAVDEEKEDEEEEVVMEGEKGEDEEAGLTESKRISSHDEERMSSATSKAARGGKSSLAVVGDEFDEDGDGRKKTTAGAGTGKESGASGKKCYFLMKAEQEDRFETLKSGREFNTKFTIDDLRAKEEPEMWDGVRNAVARNVMKEMKRGDLAFFYASGGKKGRQPGITGIVEVVKEHEPDPTTRDEDAVGFVEKESDRGKWVIVHVKFRKKLDSPVTLKTLQKHHGEGGALQGLQVLNTARLSVSRVSADEWDFINRELIEGKDGE